MPPEELRGLHLILLADEFIPQPEHMRREGATATFHVGVAVGFHGDRQGVVDGCEVGGAWPKIIWIDDQEIGSPFYGASEGDTSFVWSLIYFLVGHIDCPLQPDLGDMVCRACGDKDA